MRTNPEHYKKPCNIKASTNITAASRSRTQITGATSNVARTNAKIYGEKEGLVNMDTVWQKSTLRQELKDIVEAYRDHKDSTKKDDYGDNEDVVYMGNVHVGFCEYFQSFASIDFFNEMEAILSYYQEQKYTIYSVGHSLGGAMAAMLGTYYNIRTNEKLNVNVYTYGEPRVGDVSFSYFSQLNKESVHYRVIHSADIVPHLSFCCREEKDTTEEICSTETSCPLHGGIEIWYNLPIHEEAMTYDSNYTICDNIPTKYNSSVVGEDPFCSDSLGLKARSPEDHQYYYGKDVGSYCLDGKSVPDNTYSNIRI